MLNPCGEFQWPNFNPHYAWTLGSINAVDSPLSPKEVSSLGFQEPTLHCSLLEEHHVSLSIAGFSSAYLGLYLWPSFPSLSVMSNSPLLEGRMEFTEVFRVAAEKLRLAVACLTAERTSSVHTHRASSPAPPAHIYLSRRSLETSELALLLCACPLSTAKFQVHLQGGLLVLTSLWKVLFLYSTTNLGILWRSKV